MIEERKKTLISVWTNSSFVVCNLVNKTSQKCTGKIWQKMDEIIERKLIQSLNYKIVNLRSRP